MPKKNQQNNQRNINLLISVISAALVFVFLFSAEPAKAEYYKMGTVLSTNLLNGLSDVAIIESFDCTASVYASTTVSVNFSQNGTNWYDHNGAQGYWDNCADGVTAIDLTFLEWTSANFYYKLKFGTNISTSTATVSEVKVNYSDTYTPPAADRYGYYKQGAIVSTNLLTGTNLNFFNGTEKFGYNIASLPAGTAVYAQFSQDGVNWYSSTSTKWAWDTLLAGNHLDISGALDISGLGWTSNNFYYKLKFTTTGNSQTPVVSEIRLLRSATQVNAPITNKYTGGLVGNWTFNGPDMDWASTTAEALDRSGNANNGNVINGAKPAAGKAGQALSFDGVDDYISSNFQFSIFNFQSISNWINFQTLATDKPIIGKWGNSQNAILLKTDDTNNDELKICVASSLTDDCTNAASTTDANLTVKNWHNLQVVYDGNQAANADKLKLYLDGSQKTLSFIGTIPAVLQNSSANLEIGGDSDLGNYVNCFIDEVRVYNRALSAEEIGQLYRAGARTMKIIPTKSGKTIIGN